MHAKPHSALRQLERFIGTWGITATIQGQAMAGVQATYEWLEGGAFVVERSVMVSTEGVPAEVLAASPLPTTRIFGYDDTAETFTALYADNRAVARVYQMRVTGDRWEMWRDAPGFGQRFVGDFGADGRTISAHWEKSFDNQTWEHDFSMTYTKLGGGP